MIRATEISVSRSGKCLLDAVSAELHPGQVSVILGPNGAGKSTLLKVLTGTLPPDAGEVTFDSQPLTSMAPAALARRRAVLAQEVHLSFDFTVEEVVMLGRIPHLSGWESELDREAVDRALAAVDLEAFRSRHYPRLSGGEKQRVHLARVLAQLDAAGCASPARWLFLDEPTSALDLRHQYSTLDCLKRLSREAGFGVCAVIHDINLALRFADQVILLAEGKLAAAGAPHNTLTSPCIDAVFGVRSERVDSPETGFSFLHILDHHTHSS